MSTTALAFQIGQGFSPSSSSTRDSGRVVSGERWNPTIDIPLPLAQNEPVGVIEATVRSLKAEITSLLQSHAEFAFVESDIDANTVFYLPPNEVKEVTVRVYKAGRAKPVIAFDLSEFMIDDDEAAL